jgi:hypothetical protein
MLLNNMSKTKSATDSFNHELPLVVNPGDKKTLLIRLDCARQLYNACLGEVFRRLNLMRESKD